MLYTQFEENEILTRSELLKHVPSEALAAVQANYNEPHRHYHAWHHALSVISWTNYCTIDLGPLEGYTQLEFSLAALYHDAIYDTKVGSPGNELASVAFMKSQLADLFNRYPGTFERVERLINLTAQHGKGAQGHSLSEALFLDCDMASFGEKRWEVVLWNELNIHKEYLTTYTQEQVNVGRRHFLTLLHQNGSIFLTPHFRDLFEAQAQRNIRRLIARLA